MIDRHTHTITVTLSRMCIPYGFVLTHTLQLASCLEQQPLVLLPHPLPKDHELLS